MKKLSIVTNVRVFLLSFFALILFGCGPTERPTGYSANPGPDGYLIETCKEEEILENWWSFETDNAIANTLVPTYKDYCTYVDEQYAFLWNTVELYGYYNYSFSWYCKNENTMKIVDVDSGTDYDMRIYGKMSGGDYAGCYDVRVNDGAVVVNGYVCPCEYNGP